MLESSTALVVMSAKQVRKLRGLRQADCSDSHVSVPAPNASIEEVSDSTDGDVPISRQRPGFAALDSYSDSASSSSADADPPSANQEKPCGVGTSAAEHKEHGNDEPSNRRRRRRASRREKEGTEEKNCSNPSDPDPDSILLDGAIEGADEAGALHTDQVPSTFETSVLAMRRADFSVENERRRATGGSSGIAGPAGGVEGSSSQRRRFAARPRGEGEGRTAHYRRLYILVPSADERWARPDDTIVMSMSLQEDGAPRFDFNETPASKRHLQRLQECLQSHDPQLLQQFVRQSPFCIDALLALAHYHRMQQSYEQAHQIVRQAMYVIECNFHASFSPFHAEGGSEHSLRPRVVLQLPETESWSGWTCLYVFWLYMHGVSAQGMHRTALEVCKLLIAMSLPRDPCRALLHYDYYCLRTRQYDMLLRFAFSLLPQFCSPGVLLKEVVLRLDHTLPNFAYSVALASLYKTSSQLSSGALNDVCIADLIKEEDEAEAVVSLASTALARLMRAMLLFPLMLRPLLEEVGAKNHEAPSGSVSREAWTTLLGKPPFSNAADFRHQHHAAIHGRICALYARQCGRLWRADQPMQWLHACAARLVAMHESSVFAAELTDARSAWSRSVMCMESVFFDYVDLSSEEASSEMTKPPPMLEKTFQARLFPPREEEPEDHRDLWNRNGNRVPIRGELVPNISLHSPPLIVFFQSLLPWAELDKSGVRVERLLWSDIGSGLINAAVNIVQLIVLPFFKVHQCASDLVSSFGRRRR